LYTFKPNIKSFSSGHDSQICPKVTGLSAITKLLFAKLRSDNSHYFHFQHTKIKDRQTEHGQTHT